MERHAIAEKDTSEQFERIFRSYRGERGELIPLLQEVQDAVGYLPPDSMSAVAEFLNIPRVSVYEVASFYSQFHFTRQGKHRIKVCQGTACHVRGGKRVLAALQRKLGIGPGQTTEDYMFSLERVACFGACALAPVMVVDDKVHGRMTPQKALKLLEKLE